MIALQRAPVPATPGPSAVASGASAPVPSGVDRALDERIAVAFERVADRTSTNPIISTDTVEYAELVESTSLAPTATPGLVGGTPGPSAAAGGAVRAHSKGREREQRRNFLRRVLSKRPRSRCGVGNFGLVAGLATAR